jgi:subtilisin family serine protease
MRPRLRWLGWLCVLLLGTVPPAQSGPSNQFILRTAPNARVDELLARYGWQLLDDEPAHSVFLVRAAPDTLRAAQLEDEAETGVLGFEPLQDAWLPEAPSATLQQSTSAILDALADPSFAGFYDASAWTGYLDQPAAGLVRLPDVRAATTGRGAVVAIIDTGVDPGHSLLGPRLLPGYDFVHDVPGASELLDLGPPGSDVLSAPPTGVAAGGAVNQSTSAILDRCPFCFLDPTTLPAAFGHGTMVAGIVHLVAPEASIMPLKAFRADGRSNTFDILQAIYYAVDHGAKVINMSFSLSGPSDELQRALEFATARGVICVASAGNDGQQDPLIYPASSPNVMAVAATDDADVRSWFSNYGEELIHVAAPGEAIITAYPGDRYAAAWGTSFSAAFVTGAAALLAQVDPGTDQQRAADDLAHAVQLTEELGHGRLDLYQGVAMRHGSQSDGSR